MKHGSQLMERPPFAQTTWGMAGFWGGLVAFAYCALRSRHYFHDDAYISLRYVRNLLTAGELSWNPGEFVEGYTNLLHLLSVALLGWLGVDLERAVLLVNALSLGLLIAAFASAAHRLAAKDASGIAVGVGWLSLLTLWPLALWVLGGLETVMLMAWVCLAHAILLPLLDGQSSAPRRSALLAGSALAAAGLTRPDASLLVVSAGLVLLIAIETPFRVRLQYCALLITGPAITFAAHVGWRLYYYDAFFPNTFYAKVGVPADLRLSLGLLYVLKSLRIVPAFLCAAALAVLARTALRRSPAALCLVSGCLLYGLYVAWAGGDHMRGARFLLPVLPLASLLIVFALAQLSNRTVLQKRAGIVVALISITGAVFYRGHPMDAAAFVGTIVGRHIDATWPAGSLVALNTAGSTPYFAAKLRFIDMLGLTDPVIARRDIGPLRLPMQRMPGHAKGDGAYVLAQQPDYIIVGGAEGNLIDAPAFLSDLELGQSPAFHRCYVLHREAIDYDSAFAQKGPRRPRPLIFTYYRRLCGHEDRSSATGPGPSAFPSIGLEELNRQEPPASH